MKNLINCKNDHSLRIKMWLLLVIVITVIDCNTDILSEWQ